VESIARPDADENKALFEHLAAHKAEIESTFGGALEWQDLPGKKASRIAYWIPGSNFEDEDSWGNLQGRMIEAMGRLEAALGPHAQALSSSDE